MSDLLELNLSNLLQTLKDGNDVLLKADSNWPELLTKLKEQLSALQVENERLKELESNFYMAICRAYNAGKQCMSNQHEDARNKGKDAFNERFVSSHNYFIGEFPAFTTNVP